jgi:nicotinate-nucleotide adenylyltransferase
MQKRGVIFGGAFDPPHLGHTQVAEYVITHGYADKLVVMPVGHHPFDKKSAPATHRLAMVELAFAQLAERYPSVVSISEYELDQSGVGYSYQTLVHFATQYPEYQWRWLIGEDNVASFGKWRQADQILSEFGVLVFPRNGSSEPSLSQGMELLVDATPVDMSSTQARTLFEQARHHGQPVSAGAKVDPSVCEYIETHAVY